VITRECDRGRYHDLAHHPVVGVPREPEAEPDAQTGKQRGDETAVDLYRMLHHEPAVLDQLESGDEDAAEESIEKHVFAHSQF
jgi:hypothetical protein